MKRETPFNGSLHPLESPPAAAQYLPRESWWTRRDKPFAALRAAEQARMERSPMGRLTALMYDGAVPEPRTVAPVRADRVPPPPRFPRAV